MKYINYLLSGLFVAFVGFTSCEDTTTPNEEDETGIAGTWEGNWYFDFNGTIDGGEVYDVIKSSVDNKIYICGAFLYVNDNWDMKNLTF